MKRFEELEYNRMAQTILVMDEEFNNFRIAYYAGSIALFGANAFMNIVWLFYISFFLSIIYLIMARTKINIMARASAYIFTFFEEDRRKGPRLETRLIAHGKLFQDNKIVYYMGRIEPVYFSIISFIGIINYNSPTSLRCVNVAIGTALFLLVSYLNVMLFQYQQLFDKHVAIFRQIKLGEQRMIS